MGELLVYAFFLAEKPDATMSIKVCAGAVR
jgi:hypothetical protein